MVYLFAHACMHADACRGAGRQECDLKLRARDALARVFLSPCCFEAARLTISISGMQASQDALHQDTYKESRALEQKLQEVTAQLASVQNERQKLWEHIADLQLSASDAEQMQVQCPQKSSIY